MPKVVVGVMGPGFAARESDRSAAFALGSLIAREGWIALTGGRKEGVMGAAAKGAREAGGMTVGVLPSDDCTNLSPDVEIPIVTGMGDARNLINVLSSQVVFVCGMSAGTASEVALALKSQRDVILIQPSEESFRFWSALDALRVHSAAGPSDAIEIARRVLSSAEDSRRQHSDR